jgi:hypothetical protein
MNEADRKKQVLKIARYMGCRGAHKNEKGEWMPCADMQTLQRLSDEAENDSFLQKSELEEKSSNYTKPGLREEIKNRIMAGSRGGKPGQWSARKAQLVAQEYKKRGGGYKGSRNKKQRSLSKWTKEKWTTSDGKPAIRTGGTRRYLPSKAWAKLTPGQKRATNNKKRKGSASGQQFVRNTEAAARARRQSSKSHQPLILVKSKIVERLELIENGITKKTKRKMRGANWQKLNERGPVGISSLDGGGIVSAPILSKLIDTEHRAPSTRKIKSHKGVIPE